MNRFSGRLAGFRRQALSLTDKVFPFLLLSATLPMLMIAQYQPSHAGDIVDARCSCGYVRTQLFIFGGKGNFRTLSRFPGLCRSSAELVLFNAYNSTVPAETCPEGEITPYDHPSLTPEKSGEAVASWSLPRKEGNWTLFKGGYYCPKCGRKNLIFTHIGFWD